jgi:chemotaxis protein MotB
MQRLPMMFVAVAALALAACVSQTKYDEAQANLTSEQQKNADLEKQYQDLNEAMGAEVGAKNMQISRMQNAIKVSINSELLFPSGGWEMPAAAKNSIAKIAKILAPHQANHINVNGYTDSAPIGAGLAKQGVTTNVILSQKRADTVMNYMISQGVNPKLVSSHGLGEADPVATNDTAAGRAQNRRVELTLAN